MQIAGTMTVEKKAEYFDRVVDIMIGVTSMDLKEKEDYLEKIPKDYRLDNDMTLVKYWLWTGIRQELLELGYLGAGDTPGQQVLEI